MPMQPARPRRCAVVVLAAPAVALALALAVTGIGAAPVDDAAPRVAQAVPTYEIVIDDFEDPDWPAGGPWWVVLDEEEPDPPEYQWFPRDCHARSGRLSLWAVGGGTKGSQLPCGGSYPKDRRIVIHLGLDLRAHADAKVLNLVFDLYADNISDASLGDFLTVSYVHPTSDGAIEHVPVIDWTGATRPVWETRRIDLLDVTNLYNPIVHHNLAGEEEVVFEFLFRSMRDSTFRPEGTFIDRVRLERDGVATATPEPSASVPRPASATATATSPPVTSPPPASATPVRDAARAWLPLARRGG